MIIKKIQAKTENEAIEAARKELGENFVVMGVRNTKKKGLKGLFSPQMVEVTVALEEPSEKRVPDLSQGRSITEALGKIAPLAQKSEKETLENLSGRSEAGKDTANREENKNVLEEKLDSIHTLIEEKLKDGDSETENRDFEKKQEKEAEKDSELSRFFDLLYETMVDNEVNEDYALSIVEETRKNTKEGTPFDVALAGIYQKMILKFAKASTITPSDKGPKMIFFVGPTGVGKTTTIAKIASKFSAIEKKKIALLTADTYRIAAAEQLRTYANILEVPFKIIYTIEEMETALRDFNAFDYILVDTAGHSHQNSEQKAVMADFIHSVDGLVDKEIYLVVSATTKYRDLKSIADAYSEITEYKLIFTKLDETTALGNLLNLKLYTDAPLSYITCGQNVPDDIEEFNAQRTVKNLLGGKR